MRFVPALSALPLALALIGAGAPHALAATRCPTKVGLGADSRGSRTTETPSSGQGSGSVSRQFTYGPDGRLRTIRVANPRVPAVDCSPTQWDQVDTDVGYDQLGVLAFRRRRLGSTTQQIVRYSRTPGGEIGYTLQAGGPTGTDRVTYKYLYLSGERVLAVRETWDGGTRTSRKYLFLHGDRNGTPMAAVVADHPEGVATQQWAADRDPWGWTTVTSTFAADEIPFEFPGQLRLDGTEFTRLVSGSSDCQTEIVQPAIVSNGYRDYDPVAGIYLTRDPISRSGSNWAVSSANRNLYAYAGFNPIDRFDYWGLETPSSSDDAGFWVSLVPVLGPALGMRDAIIQGDWSMAVMNASFLVLDLSSLGAAALARDAATGGIRAVLSAEARHVATGEALAVVRNEAAQVARKSCEVATRSASAAGPKLLSGIPARITNAADHIFGTKNLAEHNLEGVLNAFNGDATAATYALENAAQSLANQGAISGVFKNVVVEVAGLAVTIRGRVMNGVAHLGTAGRPDHPGRNRAFGHSIAER